MDEPTKQSTTVEPTESPSESAALEAFGGLMIWKQLAELLRKSSSQAPLVNNAFRPALEAGSIDDLYVSWLSQNLPTSQIEEVMTLASIVFGDRQVAKEWLNEPNLATSNRPPIALLGNTEGLLRIQTLLHRIEYGVLA